MVASSGQAAHFASVRVVYPIVYPGFTSHPSEEQKSILSRCFDWRARQNKTANTYLIENSVIISAGLHPRGEARRIVAKLPVALLWE